MLSVEEIMKNQPIENIGMIGHVADGKSTIVKKITHKVTQQHSSEKKKNITIRLGYANAKIFKCPKCIDPICYKSTPSTVNVFLCPDCNEDVECILIRHVSFVDCPGHNLFTSTMLNGTCIMDTTILVEACNNPELPAPQTIEHINALKTTQLSNIVTCVNKIDLIEKEKTYKILKKFRNYLSGTVINKSDIVPVSANFNANIDILLKYIAERPLPSIIDRKINDKLKMIIIRSFNINKINERYDNIKGGVIGGSITQGILNVGDKILIKPGFIQKNKKYDHNDVESKRFICTPFETFVTSINSDKTNLDYAISGGLIGVCTTLDPSIAINDKMIGNICVTPDNEDQIYEDIKLFYDKINDVKLHKNDIVTVNHNACNNSATIKKILKDGTIILSMHDKPLCVSISEYVTISKKLNETNVIIGNGKIVDGNPCIIKNMDR